MNKLLFSFCFLALITSAPAQTKTAKRPSLVEKVDAIATPKNNNDVKKAYDVLEEASESLRKKDDDTLLIATLKGFAKVSHKDESLIGMETLAKYFEKNPKKVRDLVAKHLSKTEAKKILFGLEAMSEYPNSGNDPSVTNDKPVQP
jgi:hypothetical protein